MVIYALLLILLMIFRPQGLLGRRELGWDWLRLPPAQSGRAATRRAATERPMTRRRSERPMRRRCAAADARRHQALRRPDGRQGADDGRRRAARCTA